MEYFYEKTSRVSEHEIESFAEELEEYLAKLASVVAAGGYNAAESSVNLPSDDAMIESVLALAAEKGSEKLKYIFLIGIGGSNLGAKAVYDSRYLYRDQLGGSFVAGENGPRLICLDTVRGALAAEAVAIIEERIMIPEELLVIVVSKSGATIETAANFEIVRDALMAKFDVAVAASRCVVITDEGSPLWRAAADRRIATLPIPAQVGGRYSVFSPAGLFPLALAGFDIRALTSSARAMRDACLQPGSNLAVASAAIAFAHYDSGLMIHDLFAFGPELESLGKWWRQLVGESLGKVDGGGKREGITPTISIGSIDLHSVGQLYFGGPQARFTTFLSISTERGVRGPKNFLLFPAATDRDPDDILEAIRLGVTAACQKAGLPFSEAKLSSVTDVGAFMQWKMIETMLLAELLGVNAFDQPAVELYKEEMRDILRELI